MQLGVAQRCHCPLGLLLSAQSALEITGVARTIQVGTSDKILFESLPERTSARTQNEDAKKGLFASFRNYVLGRQ